MRNDPLLLDIRLGFLRNFLDHVVEESGAEYEHIMRRNEEGDFPDLADLESATDYPAMRQVIVARAVYYEVNSLVESVLHGAAHEPWLESDRHPGPKTLDWDNLSLQGVRSLRMISDLSFGQIVQLVEEGYGITLSNLPGWDELREIREVVNSFKHREGFIDFRRKPPEEIRIAARYEVNAEKAYRALEIVSSFVKALWRVTRKE
jgi:hypothetical protein